MNKPIIEIDVHGLGTLDALREIQKKVNQAGTGVWKHTHLQGTLSVMQYIMPSDTTVSCSEHRCRYVLRGCNDHQ